MIVLHASAMDGRLILWGETSDDRGRARNGSVARSRFALDAYGLLKSEPVVTQGLQLLKDQLETWIAWLPSNNQGALPSSPLLTPDPVGAGEVRIAAWETPGFLLTPGQAASVLTASIDRTTWGPGVVVGKTLAYWTTVLRLAGAVVARQQYLPELEETAGPDGARTFRACWKPVLAGADRLSAERLAGAMPDACRALGRSSEAPPQDSASSVFAKVLAALVDHLARPQSAYETPRKPRRRFVSPHDQWVYALGATDGTMTGDPDELASLAEQVAQWRRPLDVATAAPFRLCFRLEEPEIVEGEDESAVGDAPWRISYFLQALDDLSLMVPSQDAWKPRSTGAAVLARGGFQPRAYMLSALGQAAALCPGVEASLKSRTPTGYELDASAAHDFLANRAGALEQAGFGVFLPSWWTRKGTKLRLTAKAAISSPKLTSKAGLSLDEVLKFQWKAALGDQTLTLEELKALARLKAPLVRIRGQWVEINPDEIAAALAFWKTKGNATITAQEALRTALGAAKPPGSLAFGGVEADGWLAELLDQLEGKAELEPLDAPKGFHGELRPYQARGLSWLAFLRRWGLGACLADDMGLGKTIQTLALIEREWEATTARKRRPTLLICPTSVVGNWRKEAERFTPDLPVMVHHGADRAKGGAFVKEARKHALVLSSYALLHRDFDLFAKAPWDSLILDEAQNIKNPQTKQAKAARGLTVGHRVALTGTPVENHVGDLWSIFEFLNPGWLGTQAEFKRTFHVPIQVERDPEASRRLQSLTGPLILRRLKTDASIIADLPEKQEMKVFCTLTKEQTSLYAAVVADTTERIEAAEGVQRKGLVLATLTKLKQVCNHPAQFLGDHSAVAGRSGKLARLTEMLDEALSTGDRALVFTQFTEMGAMLRDHLQATFGREVLFLHGGTPKAHRDLMVERFQAQTDDAPPIFLLSLKAGGVGLNLTAANHVFHFDRWWNPAVENQATDRAFRIGQTRRVQVHKFVCVGTLEEKIDAMIEDKKTIAGAVIGSGESWLTKLSNAQLKELFTLRNEALGD